MERTKGLAEVLINYTSLIYLVHVIFHTKILLDFIQSLHLYVHLLQFYKER